MTQRLAFVWRHRSQQVSVAIGPCAGSFRCYVLVYHSLRASDAAQERKTLPVTCNAESREIRSSARDSAGLSLARRSWLPTSVSYFASVAMDVHERERLFQDCKRRHYPCTRRADRSGAYARTSCACFGLRERRLAVDLFVSRDRHAAVALGFESMLLLSAYQRSQRCRWFTYRTARHFMSSTDLSPRPVLVSFPSISLAPTSRSSVVIDARCRRETG